VNEYVWTSSAIRRFLGIVASRDSALIDFVEAAYDLVVEDDAWLPKLIEAGGPVLDRGHGTLALTCTRPRQPGPLVVHELHVVHGPDDVAQRFAALTSAIDMELLWPLSRSGAPKTLSEVTDDHNPAAFSVIMQHFGFAKDGLGISGFDPDGRGIFLIIPLSQVTSLTAKARVRWQMLAAHFGAGYRLRRAIQAMTPEQRAPSELPFGAEAIIDPKNFQVTEASGDGSPRRARDALRLAALRIDSARGEMRKSDPGKALEIWAALVRGRWSTVDWFDTDGRRYLLAMPNAPEVADPRGFTEREMQVLSYAFFGLSNKMIAYHLGLSKGRVSALLSSAQRKFGVKSRTQLIKKLKVFTSIAGP